MVRERKNPGLVGPLILIAAGVLFLLNNLGLVGWDVWTFLARFWPLILIGIGLDVLIGSRSRGAVVAVLLIIGAIMWVGWTWGPTGQSVATMQSISQRTDGAERAAVHIAPGVASLHIGAATDPNVLIEGTVRTGRGERLEQDFRISNGKAAYTLESEQDRGAFPFFMNNEGREWDLRLNPDLPTALTVDAGVGRIDLALEDLQLTELVVNAGVGETIVTLPASGRLEVEVQMGVGSTTIRIPRDMAARIHASRGIGAVDVRGDFEREGDFYTSPNFDRAEHRVDLWVEGGVGEIDIETY